MAICSLHPACFDATAARLRLHELCRHRKKPRCGRTAIDKLLILLWPLSRKTTFRKFINFNRQREKCKVQPRPFCLHHHKGGPGVRPALGARKPWQNNQPLGRTHRFAPT
jgi:hypothetical protein